MNNPAREERYVLVACGEAVHTRTLRYALHQLQVYSDKQVWVVTDQRRNEEAIDHPLLIDVATPAGLSHHQAAIYLKTSLHRYLDMQHLYCYLDTDVLAIRAGVDTIFGYPGGAIMPIYDALYDYNERLKHILVRHEQGAIHAAQGYARVSGKTGVVFATSGPGATKRGVGVVDARIHDGDPGPTPGPGF